MRVVLLGCGYTGKVLIRKLQAQGHEVVATSRDPQSAAQFTKCGVEAHVWTAPEPLPCRADAAIILYPPRGIDPVESAAVCAAVPRVVYCSSTSVYGPRSGGWVDDYTPVAPTSPWATARVLAEREFLERGGVVVRAAGIYGAQRNIIHRLRSGRLRLSGDMTRPVNLIHVDDLADILWAAIQRGRESNVYLAASGNPVPWLSLASAASALSGLPLPAPTPMPNDPNLRMFYAETKRCEPRRLGELNVRLAHPHAINALYDMSC
ncbi:MAG: nucleoside-diphosphate-sugar epimerase [Myxococcota bacterium]|jgi:nucleoside-diphosphate-sugar epimerase